MKEIIFQDDIYKMNWLREDFTYADVKCPAEIEAKVVNQKEGEYIYTEVTFTNRCGKPFFSHIGDIAIAFPLQDKYEDSATCERYRCHTHIFCGGNVSYIVALRMGGEVPHLGMVLTEGSLCAYSVERDIEKQSNDRGCFWLHPSPMEFAPGESRTIAWKVFPHNGKEDFFIKAGELAKFVRVKAERYVLFPGEKCEIQIQPSFTAECVMVDGNKIKDNDGVYSVCIETADYGEKKLEVCVDGIRTWVRLFVQERTDILASRRCRFIADKQQYFGNIEQLNGAYLAYDNEEGSHVYSPENDYNGGRERIGMGNMLCAYLQGKGKEKEAALHESLLHYVEYIKRELVEVDTGRVSNDIGRDDSFKRLYNLPWYATFFCEMYRLYGQENFLSYACRIIRYFYVEGGMHFYPIELPVVMLTQALEQAGMSEEKMEMKILFQNHGDWLIEMGLNYPAHEVNYEQSIVAPAADILFKVYMITGEEKYLKAGKQQMEVLELFNGIQPDYHLYETAIRHWDGYWFGKRKLYGDTFPHYWSALTGNVFELYGKITGDERYLKKAENSRRGVLPLIFPDGSASCAYLYPYSINGMRGEFYDPFANDQDWGLYFYLRGKQNRECGSKIDY